MILDLDIGNSRISWLLSQAAKDGRATGHAENLAELLSSVDTKIKDATTKQIIKQIRVSCVLQDDNKKQELLQGIEKHWQITPELAKTQKQHKELTIAYEDAAKLGVDRWLALLAARHISGITSKGEVILASKSSPADIPKHQLIIDAGTAVSIDLLDGSQHIGGLLIPGNDSIKEAFISRTQLPLEADNFSAAGAKASEDLPNWGEDSQTCLDLGVDSMVAIFLQYKVAEFFKHYKWGRVLITGGGGTQVCEHFDFLRAQHQPMHMQNAELEYVDCLVCYGLEYSQA